MFDIIKSIYDNTAYSIILNGKITPKYSSFKGIKQGDTLSTLLFNIYLNDLPEFLPKQPNDPVEIDNTLLNSLMFADDLVLLSTSYAGLQRCIDSLSDYCKKWNLKINHKKTKIVTFSKSGKVEPNNHNIDGTNIEKATEYKYLGFVFTSNGSMTTGINRLAKQGQKAWFCIQRYLLACKHKTIHTWLKLFDVLVKPILLYACEAWGEATTYSLNGASPLFKDSFEKLQLKICKQILGVHRKTMNIPVLAELGRFPLKISIDTHMIKYFIRLNNIPTERLVYKAYKETIKSGIVVKDKWLSHIKNILDESGQSYIWTDQLNERNRRNPSNHFAKNFSLRLKDIYSQNALSYLNKDDNTNRGKMQFLRQIKDTYQFEHYLNIENDLHRKSTTQLRLSAHKLAIETGRWHNVPRENRFCKHCDMNAIETESHFLFECHNYSEGRKAMIDFIKDKTDFNFQDSLTAKITQLQNLKSLFKLGELSSLNSLGKFIFESFKNRDKSS